MSEKWVGASIEVNNNQVYDPLDLLKLHDIAPTVFPHAKWLRESELKHCRIAMLASIGAFTAQYGLVIPGIFNCLQKFGMDFEVLSNVALQAILATPIQSPI
jgi:hypothetical protein